MDKLLINKITVDNAAEANLLFLDSPAGVGFSYSNTSTDYDNLGDDFTGDECMLLFNFPHPHLSQKYFFFGFLWFWLELDEWINLIWWLIFVTVISVYLSISVLFCCKSTRGSLLQHLEEQDMQCPHSNQANHLLSSHRFSLGNLHLSSANIYIYTYIHA